jgi:acetoin utilization protein AcuB
MSEKKDLVAFVMTKDPITIDSRSPVKAALQKMIEHDIGGLIVVTGETKIEPIGIITERDVTRRSLDPIKGSSIYERPIGQVMSQPLITVPPTTPVWVALETMLSKKIRRLPVLDHKQLIGIVT